MQEQLLRQMKYDGLVQLATEKKTPDFVDRVSSKELSFNASVAHLLSLEIWFANRGYAFWDSVQSSAVTA